MTSTSPSDEIATLIRESNTDRLVEELSALPPSELSHVVSRLEDDERARLFELLPSAEAAAIARQLPQTLAAEIVSELEYPVAAAIVDRLPSDDQTDLLAALDKDQAQAVLEQMAPTEAADVNRLAGFRPDTAGGLMATEFLTFPARTTIAEVVTNLRRRADEYAQFPVQYVYVVSDQGQLQGVVRLRDLLFYPDERLLTDLPLRKPAAVRVDSGLPQLRDFFERNMFFAAPVVDAENRLVGVVTRADFDDASADQAARTMLRFSGIVFREEFRTMGFLSRVSGRLAWLSITMLLSFLAASVVGLFQGTLSEVIALAVFLPVISGMSGNAGNQAIAVSMRELSLGLVRPDEIIWVLMKEAGVGIVNGLALGFTLMMAAVIWKGDVSLGLVVGGAQMLSILLAACLGGVVPLLLKRLGVDPAVASAPLLTTITDAAGFFLTLGLAALWLAR